MKPTATTTGKKPHIYEIDLIRAITVFSVVAIHSLSYTGFLITSTASNQWYNLLIHALHYNREMFMFVTGLVLTYVYYHRPFSAKNFWMKRALLVIIPYVLWSVIYTILNNHGLDALGYIKLSLINSFNGNASFQLYYILLSIQFYAVFPLFLKFMKRVAAHPWKTLILSLILQLIFAYIDFHVLLLNYPRLTKGWQMFVQYQDRIFLVYQFFFILGSFAGLYLDKGRSFVDRHAKSIIFLFLGALSLYSGYYFFEITNLHQAIQQATTVIQPSVALYSFFVILFFAWVTTRWVRNMFGYKIVHIISETSFGIYFVHVLALSLITQFLLPIIPPTVPVILKVVGVLLLAFTVSTVFCYGLLRTPFLSWTIGRAQSVGQPIRTVRLWIANTTWYKKLILILFGAGATVFIVKTPLPLSTPKQVPAALADTYFSYQYAQIPQRPIFVFKHDAIKNSILIINKPVQSPGCSSTVSFVPGTATTVELLSDATPRIYRIYIPLHYHNTVPHALVLNFHGYASTAFRQERISHFDKLADQKDLIIVYPQGTPDRNGVLGWNTGLHPSIRSNDLLFVSNLLNQVQSHVCVDPYKIYATGFSNGGGFVNELACTMSGRIAAFAPISGSYVSSFKGCALHRPVSLIEFHGTADRTVPYNGNRKRSEYSVSSWATNWAEHDKCTMKPQVVYDSKQIVGYIWSGCEDQSSVEHYKLVGVRHVWPNLNFSLSNNQQQEHINTTHLIWDFFEKHPLYSTPNSTT